MIKHNLGYFPILFDQSVTTSVAQKLSAQPPRSPCTFAPDRWSSYTGGNQSGWWERETVCSKLGKKSRSSCTQTAPHVAACNSPSYLLSSLSLLSSAAIKLLVKSVSRCRIHLLMLSTLAYDKVSSGSVWTIQKATIVGKYHSNNLAVRFQTWRCITESDS